MSTVSSTLTPARAVLRTEARLFGREPGALFWIMVFPTALLAILGSVPSFREVKAGLGGLSVVAVYVPTSILLSMLMASVQTMPQVLLAYRETGVLRRLRTTPVRPSVLLAAQVLLHAGAVVVSSILVVTVGRLAFDAPLPGSWPGYLLTYVLTMLATFGVGAVVTALSPNTRVGGAVSTIVVFPLMFTAGLWLPVRAMPDVLRHIVEYTPLGAASDAMTDAMAGHFPGGVHLVVLAVWAVALSVISVRTFRWE